MVGYRSLRRHMISSHLNFRSSSSLIVLTPQGGFVQSLLCLAGHIQKFCLQYWQRALLALQNLSYLVFKFHLFSIFICARQAAHPKYCHPTLWLINRNLNFEVVSRTNYRLQIKSLISYIFRDLIEKNKSLAESDGVTIPLSLAEYTTNTKPTEEAPDMNDLNLDSDYEYYNDSDCYYSDDEEYEDDWC